MIEQPGDDRVTKTELEGEMRKAYLDYSMSVIVARALPDVRDGIKQVQRRILWAMHDMGMRPTAGYRKSAAIVGEVMGKYHPHGDVPIYDALVRLAQDFAARYPLVQGQGNFGCFSGDTKVEMYQGEPKTLAELVDMAHKGLRAEVFLLVLGGQGVCDELMVALPVGLARQVGPPCVQHAEVVGVGQRLLPVVAGG